MEKKLILNVFIIAVAALVFIGCGKTASNENVTLDDRTYSLAQEKSKKTDIVVFTVKDAAGNDVTLEGVAVTDEHGNAVITVTDANGNEIKVNAKAEKDADGNTVIKDAVVVNGGEITKADGSTVEIADNTDINDVKNNNDGSVKTDVGLSEDKKQEVAAEQEHEKEVEQAKEEVAKVEETNAGTTQPSTVKPTEEQTEAPTEAPTPALTEPETEAPTEAPTPAPTEPETEAPTEAPTPTPTEPETEAPANNMPYPYYTVCEYNGYGGYFYPRDREENMKPENYPKRKKANQEASMKYGNLNYQVVYEFDDMGKVNFQVFHN